MSCIRDKCELHHCLRETRRSPSMTQACEDLTFETPASVAPRSKSPALSGPLQAPAYSRRELAVVIGISALLHAGGAVAAMRGDDEVRVAKAVSRVRIEVARAPTKVRPAEIPKP